MNTEIMNKVRLSFKKHTLQIAIFDDKFKFPSKNCKFDKPVSTTVSLKAF